MHALASTASANVLIARDQIRFEPLLLDRLVSGDNMIFDVTVSLTPEFSSIDSIIILVFVTPPKNSVRLPGL